MYTYIYIYLCKCNSINTNMYVNIYLSIYIYKYIYVYIYIYIYCIRQHIHNIDRPVVGQLISVIIQNVYKYTYKIMGYMERCFMSADMWRPDAIMVSMAIPLNWKQLGTIPIRSPTPSRMSRQLLPSY